LSSPPFISIPPGVIASHLIQLPGDIFAGFPIYGSRAGTNCDPALAGSALYDPSATAPFLLACAPLPNALVGIPNNPACTVPNSTALWIGFTNVQHPGAMISPEPTTLSLGGSPVSFYDPLSAYLRANLVGALDQYGAAINYISGPLIGTQVKSYAIAAVTFLVNKPAGASTIGTPKIWWARKSNNSQQFGLGAIADANAGTSVTFFVPSLFIAYAGEDVYSGGNGLITTLGWDDIFDLEIGVTCGSGDTVNISNLCITPFSRMNHIGVSVFTQLAIANELPATSNAMRNALNDWHKPMQAASKIFYSCLGATYPAWISSGGRSNGYAPSTSFAIEQPAYAIEWILREKLGVPGSAINIASFDLIGNTTNGLRNGWLLASSIQTQKDAMDHLKQICYEFGLILFFNSAGQYTLVALDPQSTAYTIEPADVAGDGQNGMPQIAVDFTPTDGIVNDITLNYQILYHTGQPARNIYVADIDGSGTDANNLASDTGAPRDTYTNWMNGSVSKYAMRNQYNGTLEFIRDPATAELALKKMCDWQAYRRMIVRLKLIKNVHTLALEIGDVIQINNALLNANTIGNVQFIVTRVNYPAVGKSSEAIITLECEEIPNKYTGQNTVAHISDERLKAA
jgi:hypothetical protein